jgi:hypothetical protein
MAAEQQNPVMAMARVIGRGIAVVVVFAWAVLDELLFPLFRPLIGWLSGFRIFERIGALIAGAPPYMVLVTLAVPFILIEPVKVFALYWTAVGHIVQGTILLLSAHVISVFTLDRIFHTGKDQLYKIAWFARLMNWLVALRDWAFGWVKHTAAWKSLAALARGVRDWFRTLVRPTR